MVAASLAARAARPRSRAPMSYWNTGRACSSAERNLIASADISDPCVRAPQKLRRHQQWSASKPHGFGWATETGGARRMLSSGNRTLEAVVRELRSQGRLPSDGSTAETEGVKSSAGSRHGFVDIDDQLAEGFADQGEDWGDGAYDADGHAFAKGFEDPGASFETAASRGEAFASVSTRSRADDEDVHNLTEEELRDRVRKSIEELVPRGIAESAEETRTRLGRHNDADLTPAQIFYLENRERLVSRAQEYYLEKQREQLEQREDPEGVEDEWRFYHDPVVRPRKGHLWSTGQEEYGGNDQHATEDSWMIAVSGWPKGRVPEPTLLADLLRAEQARDVNVVDLQACGRHDVGTHAIVATGITTRHCRRLGDIAARATQNCQAPHVEAFCYGTRNDEWVVAHCGPIKVHLFTREAREEYRLEDLWERPEEFFLPGDFPHYLEIYGTATEAFPGEHITHARGSRSPALAPPPFRDDDSAFNLPDYDAAEDARYVARTPPQVLGTFGGPADDAFDVGGAVGEAPRHTDGASFRSPAWPGVDDHDRDAETDDEDDIRPAFDAHSDQVIARASAAAGGHVHLGDPGATRVLGTCQGRGGPRGPVWPIVDDDDRDAETDGEDDVPHDIDPRSDYVRAHAKGQAGDELSSRDAVVVGDKGADKKTGAGVSDAGPWRRL